jgi:3-deoxy-D-manno-octulosonic-acid transferase
MTALWLHGASAGDMRAIAPLIAGIEKRWPEFALIVTAWTQSGVSMGKKLYPDLGVRRPPMPLRATARRFLRRNKIRLLLLEYLELYPGWIDACHGLNIPVLVVDGRVSQRSIRIRWILKRYAKHIAAFCAQTISDAQHARQIGVPDARISVTGNGKFDGLPIDSANCCDGVSDPYGARQVVIGSLHADEEADAIAAIKHSGLRVLVAPRYLSRVSPIMRRARRAGISVSRHSLGEHPAQLHILDTYGDLASAYAHAPVNIVGGTFGRRGGQNLFEPALHNNVIVHGPNTENISLEAETFAGRGAYQVQSWREAVGYVGKQLPSALLDLAVLDLKGATEAHLAVLGRLIASIDGPQSEASDG